MNDLRTHIEKLQKISVHGNGYWNGLPFEFSERQRKIKITRRAIRKWIPVAIMQLSYTLFIAYRIGEKLFSPQTFSTHQIHYNLILLERAFTVLITLSCFCVVQAFYYVSGEDIAHWSSYYNLTLSKINGKLDWGCKWNYKN